MTSATDPKVAGNLMGFTYILKASVVLFDRKSKEEPKTFSFDIKETDKVTSLPDIAVANNGQVTLSGRKRSQITPLFKAEIVTFGAKDGTGNVGHVIVHKTNRNDTVLLKAGPHNGRLDSIEPMPSTGFDPDTVMFNFPTNTRVIDYEITIVHQDGTEEPPFYYTGTAADPPETQQVGDSVESAADFLMVFSKSGKLQETLVIGEHMETGRYDWWAAGGGASLADQVDTVYAYTPFNASNRSHPDEIRIQKFKKVTASADCQEGATCERTFQLELEDTKYNTVNLNASYWDFTSSGNYLVLSNGSAHNIYQLTQTTQTLIFEHDSNIRASGHGDYDPKSKLLLMPAGHFEKDGEYGFFYDIEEPFLIVYNMAAPNSPEAKKIISLAPLFQRLGLQGYTPLTLTVNPSTETFSIQVGKEVSSGWDGHSWARYDYRLITGRLSELYRDLEIKI